MTMIVFDGINFITDGKSSYRTEAFKPTMDFDDEKKLIMLQVPLISNTGFEHYCFAGTGKTADCALLAREISRAAKAGEKLEYVSTRLESLLIDKMHGLIVSIGKKMVDGKLHVQTECIFQSRKFANHDFFWLSDWIAIGATDHLPAPEDAPFLKTSMDVMTLAHLLEPGSVGGLLTRYNVITDKVDHPTIHGLPKQLSLLNHWKKLQVKQIDKLFSTGMGVIEDLRSKKQNDLKLKGE